MKKLSQVEPIENADEGKTEMMADFCKGYAPLRDGMRSNRQHWTDVAKEKGLDLEAPAKKGEKDDGYANLWEKYWNMDPENFIWGIDPNEAPPEVVIERVVFSPKKKVGKTFSNNSNSEITSSPKLDGKKKKNNRKGKLDTPSSKKSPAPSVNSDSSSNSKNSRTCRVM